VLSTDLEEGIRSEPRKKQELGPEHLVERHGVFVGSFQCPRYLESVANRIAYERCQELDDVVAT